MPAITEGNITFTFPDEWSTIKYDETHFYRNKIEKIGAELAAVDFIVAQVATSNLLLIEIKDFRRYAAINRKRQASGDLIDELLKKGMHTLSALYLAAYTNNAELNAICRALVRPPENIELILFMEEDPEHAISRMELHNQKTRINDMNMKLRRVKSHVGVNGRVLNARLLKERDGWIVTML